MPAQTELEGETRKRRIDTRLEAQGWTIVRYATAAPPSAYRRHAVTEFETTSGPADYALFVDGQPVGVIEAKRVSLAPQNVLQQAVRYARGLPGSPHNFAGLRVPFLYATNGEVTWFRDVRSGDSRSRTVADFHTPAALAERLAHDDADTSAALAASPNAHPDLRAYQRDANAAVEKAIAEGKRTMLVAMATGTGKTLTTVNQIYRLMRAGVALRILFLVDRRALAAQAVRAFTSFEPEPYAAANSPNLRASRSQNPRTMRCLGMPAATSSSAMPFAVPSRWIQILASMISTWIRQP